MCTRTTPPLYLSTCIRLPPLTLSPAAKAGRTHPLLLMSAHEYAMYPMAPPLATPLPMDNSNLICTSTNHHISPPPSYPHTHKILDNPILH